MLVQVYNLQHSGLQLLKTGLSVARMCETVVLSPWPGQPWCKGRGSYLAYYHTDASGGIPSFKFSTGA